MYRTVIYRISCSLLLCPLLSASPVDTAAASGSAQACSPHSPAQEDTAFPANAVSPYSRVREAFSQYEQGSATYTHVLEVEAACIIQHLMEDQSPTSSEKKSQLLRQLEKNYQQQLAIAKQSQNSVKATAIEAEMNATLAKLKDKLGL